MFECGTSKNQRLSGNVAKVGWTSGRMDTGQTDGLKQNKWMDGWMDGPFTEDSWVILSMMHFISPGDEVFLK